MTTTRIAGIVVLVLALVAAWLSVFYVDERERAIKFRLGEIVRADYAPGLHFQTPVINNVRKFDARVLTLDSSPQPFLTGEKKNVIVDYFVKWRIGKVENYYRSFGGRERDAALRLSQTMRDGLQAELGNRTIREVVSGERREIMQNLVTRTDERMNQFGIDIVDVRIKQIELPTEVRNSVFNRMRAERERIAKEHRAQGQKEAAIIRAKADRERTELLAAARREAEELRGTGDAEATRIYAEAFGEDAEFFEFYRSLEAYRQSFADKDDILVLEPNSEFFKYFNQTQAPR
ncbi:MAG: protease modulator HflC [Gammaproteobacteria bacterium]|nr:protease modulator HflC [Gammaproteobacteria bacterium]NIR27945.1 protease modulator HflC [Gammaproteobacteria bacterium]NIR96593.1 protease modulator HflC [Gammaproteobacteria bacterium]NIT62317.1 protease modulator HflC [Gammaproteobacteria bacterium]NIV19240.1 protease modulator HflC [Gammaproteobacteria bacterium]